MTVLVDSTRALTAETYRRLAATRRLIERNRRCLNPWWGLSGSSDGPNVRRIVIHRLSRGSLPAAPTELWAGNGTGRICIVCDQMITPMQLEAQLIDDRGGVTVKIWAHMLCYDIWRYETRTQ